MGSEAQSDHDHGVSHAILSVYYQTAGRQFEVRGAPSVFLPPEVRPMPLAEALAILNQYAPDRLREAMWRVVRSVPATPSASERRTSGFGGPQRYPAAIQPYISGKGLAELVRLRAEYRRYANLFSAALIACRDGDYPDFADLLKVLGQRKGGFTKAATVILGREAVPDLSAMAAEGNDNQRLSRFSDQIGRIESDIGCSIQEFVEGIADAAAFDGIVRRGDVMISAPTSESRVYPICTIIRQDTQNLVTTATSTAIVDASFEDICAGVDPARWDQPGSIVKKVRFVRDPFDPAEVSSPQFGDRRPAFLHEQAEVAWSGRPDQRATFANVINVVSSILPGRDDEEDSDTPHPTAPRAEVRYNLCRSIESSVLWDVRAGGLLVDQGYIKVRSIGGGRWQVTLRKEVQFSDRTPYVNGDGWRDFGQLANYLAPSTLTWWLECDTYRIGGSPSDDRPRPRKRPRRRVGSADADQAVVRNTEDNVVQHLKESDELDRSVE